ncbi:unnamed protein product [Amoebophrya sp. A120]|nr:unnamed protein product [Amoebophrya sp. A120]|eukprot:GSA120T00022443001.1
MPPDIPKERFSSNIDGQHLALASNSRAQQEDEEEEATKAAASSTSRISATASTTTGADEHQSSSFSNRGSSKSHGHAEKMFDFFRQLPDVDASTAALDASVHEHYKMHLVDYDLTAGDGGAKLSAKEFASCPPAPPPSEIDYSSWKEDDFDLDAEIPWMRQEHHEYQALPDIAPPFVRERNDLYQEMCER